MCRILCQLMRPRNFQDIHLERGLEQTGGVTLHKVRPLGTVFQQVLVIYVWDVLLEIDHNDEFVCPGLCVPVHSHIMILHQRIAFFWGAGYSFLFFRPNKIPLIFQPLPQVPLSFAQTRTQ